MTAQHQRNKRRARALAVGRAFKSLFRGACASRRRRWRELFLADDAQLRRVAETVLADLRDFCFANPASGERIFAADALIMARRLGRREVFDRIIAYLNLDEARVQLLMEIDDGD